MPMYDAYLGAYSQEPKFCKLSGCITHYTLARCLKNQLILKADSNVSVYSIPAICCSIYSMELEKGLSNTFDASHRDYIAFPNLSLRLSGYLPGKSRSEITAIHLDTFKFIQHLLDTVYLSGMAFASSSC
ncbi:hypothetical protein DI09_32p170 [Mitosporidium daphniae]|uniref:Uncharacterized protein n=1 Tax=Mitosporidium daphniae TaxID=1485682 RepID=A0A098VR78_9MICR|nr:uncharacterized protein DI09_32p170 [Mitosporidium daphniae]KGG51532.1 hypothetical protein DI09_32p170 [Mitosporidium daphniae]|eukprot:XP_013237959.1 uncharacterized protein DI09_32p170 [Mitosporidium daphniae]